MYFKITSSYAAKKKKAVYMIKRKKKKEKKEGHGRPKTKIAKEKRMDRR
jgi:hypothetical protein